MNAKRPGPGVVEYAVVLALVAVLAAVGAAAAFGVGVGDVLRSIGELVGW